MIRKSSRGNPWHDERGRFTNGPGAVKTVRNDDNYYQQRTEERLRAEQEAQSSQMQAEKVAYDDMGAHNVSTVKVDGGYETTVYTENGDVRHQWKAESLEKAEENHATAKAVYRDAGVQIIQDEENETRVSTARIGYSYETMVFVGDMDDVAVAHADTREEAEANHQRLKNEWLRPGETNVMSHGEMRVGDKYMVNNTTWQVVRIYQTDNSDLHYKTRYRSKAIQVPDGYAGAMEMNAGFDGGQLGDGPAISDRKGGWKLDERDEWEKKYNVTYGELKSWGITKEQWEVNYMNDRKKEKSLASLYEEI